MSNLDRYRYRQMFGQALEERYRRKDQFEDGMARINATRVSYSPARTSVILPSMMFLNSSVISCRIQTIGQSPIEMISNSGWRKRALLI